MIELIRKNRNLILALIDIIIMVLGYLASIIFLNISLEITTFIKHICIVIVTYEIFLNIFRMYKNMLHYEVAKDYIKYVLTACLAIGVDSVIGRVLDFKYLGLRINVLSGIFISCSFIIYRLALRSILMRKAEKREQNAVKTNIKPKRVLIIGAGIGAKEIIVAIKNSMRYRYDIVGIIDDNKNKLNHYILGIKIIGTRYDITRIAKEYDVDLIFFAINKISAISRRKILEICQETGVKTRVLPTTEAVINKQGAINSLRNVQVEDLLGREPIVLDNKNIKSLIENNTVLITGGGGSIGSELCRQIIKHKPKQLIILDIYENSLYEIERELQYDYPKANIKAIIGSVRDNTRLNEIFSKYRPELVFHAAAHKHVPLMENSPLEAIKNNIFGTYNVVNNADKYGVKKFVLISTDKAVNPTNIMGATKRVCEMIVQTKNKISQTDFVAVRFGNVLGSNGSVIPLLKKQIEKGGPVTVTHKEITRFFMTIPEAVQLILQAVTYAKGGEIFVLDMGEPVKIYDLAVSLIRLSGYEPEVDIPIKITGLRPGEKLYEEILMAEEGLTSTKHDKIFITKPMHLEKEELDEKLEKLSQLEYNEEYSKEKVKEIMKSVVPTYKEPEIVNGGEK